jgi:hypothetical protein
MAHQKLPTSAFPPPTSLSRRDLLRVGSIGISGSILPGLGNFAWGAPSGQISDVAPKATAKSVIYLMMMGGVTHIDSFDPKPDAPDGIRGTLSTISTKLPGVQFTEVMPHLAQVADKLCLVRSFSHGSNDHFLSQAYSLSGREVPMSQIATEPNIGSIVSYLHGPRQQLPGYIAVPGITRPGPPPTQLFGGGWLGGKYNPFAVGGEPEQPDFTKGPNYENPAPEANEDLLPQALSLPKGFDVERLARRSQLRDVIDANLRAAERRDAFDAMDGHYQNAFHLIGSSSVREAFDLSREPDSLRSTYGRTKIGGRCMLARRLVEAGARFVMVDYGYDPDYGNLWDNHNAPSQNHPPICDIAKRPYHLAGMDKAFAALLTDLDSRGLLDSTLVVFMTEFGRTPKINARGGRDHWGPAGSMFFAGGGTKGGQVIGATDKQAAYPTTPGHTPADVAATLYRAVGITPDTRLFDRHKRPHFVLPHGEAIPGVLS